MIKLLFVAAVIGEHEICGSAIAIKKAIDKEQKEIIAAGGAAPGRGEFMSFKLEWQCNQALIKF